MKAIFDQYDFKGGWEAEESLVLVVQNRENFNSFSNFLRQALTDTGLNLGDDEVLEKNKNNVDLDKANKILIDHLNSLKTIFKVELTTPLNKAIVLNSEPLEYVIAYEFQEIYLLLIWSSGA